MSAFKGIAAGVGGLVLAGSASAAPFLNVNILGRVQGSGQPFGSEVIVTGGEIVEYQVHILLAPEGANNPNAGAAGAASNTISNWVPSQGSTSPTSGLNNLRFSLTQEGTPGTIQSNFAAGLAGQTTGGGSWGVALGSSPGTVTPRGNGNNNLINVGLLREPGNFDGIAANPTPPPAEIQEDLVVAVGTFQIASGGNSSVVNVDLTGVPSGTIAGYRWQNPSGGNVNYTQTLAHQAASVVAGNPIIVYGGLALVPEPATLGLLGLAAVAGLRRRRA
jgi:hypothetical protein